MSTVPLPQSGKFIESIWDTSQKVVQNSQISIEEQNIERLLASDAFASTIGEMRSLPGVAMPLKFASILDELNVLSLLALLNFGSSFDAPLRAQTGHGASNAIRALIFSMYLSSTPSSGDLLSAEGMKTLSATQVAEFMGVNVHVEKAHATIPGIVVGELGGPVHRFVHLVTSTINETGTILLNSGYPNLGFLVVEALKEGERAQSAERPNAISEVVIEKVVRALPAFRDMNMVDGQPVYLFSKALYLLNAIETRFGSVFPPPFPVPPLHDLPPSVDGVSTSLFVHLGITNVQDSPSLRKIFPPDLVQASQTLLGPKPAALEAPQWEEGPSIDNEHAFRLRAAVVVAVRKMVEAADRNARHLKVTVPKINIWLQSIARERSDYRAIGAIRIQDNVFF